MFSLPYSPPHRFTYQLEGPMIGDNVSFGYGSAVGVNFAHGYGGAVGVDDPEHGGKRRLGAHRATDRDVPLSEIRFCRRAVDLRRVYRQQ